VNSDSRPPAPWRRTPRGRRELLAVGLFCLANLLVPLLITDLYPFSRAPMFADAPQRFADYTVTGPDKQPLPPADFGLQRNYWGNPLGIGVGYNPPPSADEFGAVASEETVRQTVSQRLQQRADLRYVDVVQTIIGALDSGGVGEVASQRWRIDNPAYRGEGGR
jgi:hypothetical protein